MTDAVQEELAAAREEVARLEAELVSLACEADCRNHAMEALAEENARLRAEVAALRERG
jgi:regulator of replication initiation timing